MLTVISNIILCFYLGLVIYLYGWLPSISDSFYRLKDNLKWVFSVVLWVVSMLLMVDGGTNLMYLAGAFIMMVGAEPHFKDSKGESTMHYVYAVLGIGCGIASMWVDFNRWELPIAFILLSLLVKVLKVNNGTFWIEVLALELISFGLITR